MNPNLRTARTLERRCIEHAFTPSDTFTIERIATAIGDKYLGERNTPPIYTDHTFPICADCRRATRQARADLLGYKRVKMPKPANYPSAGAYVQQSAPINYLHEIEPVTDDQKFAIWRKNVAAWGQAPIGRHVCSTPERCITHGDRCLESPSQHVCLGCDFPCRVREEEERKG